MKNLIIMDESHNYLDHMLSSRDAYEQISNEIFKVPFSNEMDVHQYNLLLFGMRSRFQLMELDVEYPLNKEKGKVAVYLTDGKRVITLDGNNIGQSELALVSELTGAPIAMLAFLLSKSTPMYFIPSVCRAYHLNYVII